MRGVDRRVLAQDKSFALVAAACKELRTLWDQHEQAHAAAATHDEARRAAAPLLEVCATCPITVSCREWARIDGYTGIAAGQAWHNGEQRPPHSIRRRHTAARTGRGRERRARVSPHV